MSVSHQYRAGSKSSEETLAPRQARLRSKPGAFLRLASRSAFCGKSEVDARIDKGKVEETVYFTAMLAYRSCISRPFTVFFASVRNFLTPLFVIRLLTNNLILGPARWPHASRPLEPCEGILHRKAVSQLETSLLFAHQGNIVRYKKLLHTYLTDHERVFIRHRLEEERQAIAQMGSVDAM